MIELTSHVAQRSAMGTDGYGLDQACTDEHHRKPVHVKPRLIVHVTRTPNLPRASPADKRSLTIQSRDVGSLVLDRRIKYRDSIDCFGRTLKPEEES
jgi:hypothetical protein